MEILKKWKEERDKKAREAKAAADTSHITEYSGQYAGYRGLTKDRNKNAMVDQVFLVGK